MNSLADRMKRYELASHYILPRRSCCILRCDGRAFHTLTRHMSKPFDQYLMKSMVRATQHAIHDMQGFKLGYVQSDEVSFLLTDFDTIHTQAWFDYDIQKLVSITASMMAAHLTRDLNEYVAFDGRAFLVPQDDVANYFLWRAKDWERNSLTMYANAFFSPKQLHGKNQATVHDMLHEIGKNWTNDLTEQERNGTFVLPGERELIIRSDIVPHYAAIADLCRLPTEEGTCRMPTAPIT